MMEKRKELAFLVMVLVLAIGLGGCGEGDTGGGEETTPGAPAAVADLTETTPIADIQTMVASMDMIALREAATKFKDMIVAKQDEFANLTEQGKSIAVTELDKLAELKTELDALTASITALAERGKIFVDKITELGGDVGEFSVIK